MGLNFRAIIKILGILTLIEGLFMLPAVAAGLYYEEWKAAGSLFTISLICISVGFVILTQFRFDKICAFMHADVARIMPLAGRNGNSRASDFYLPSMGNK